MAKHKTRQNRYIKPKNEPSTPEWKRLLILVVKVFSGVAVILVFSLVFVFLHDMIMQCNYLRARTINVEIEGMNRVTPQKIEKLAQIQKGVNILSVNLPVVQKRLLSNPWIETAYVRRDYSSTLTIRVVEHHPLAIIDFGHMYLIDDKGVVFTEVGKSDFPDLPVISGLNYLDWTKDNGSSNKVFSAVMTVLKLGQGKDAILPNKMINEIDVDKDIGLTLRTASPVEIIRLGYGRYKEKYQRLASVLSYQRQNEASPQFYSMDLRNPDRIVAKPEKIEKTSTPDKKEA